MDPDDLGRRATAGANLQLDLRQPQWPGRVSRRRCKATVTYTLAASNALTIQYQATTNAPTVINLTNHSYFNLDGQASGNVYGQKLLINADRYTPTDATSDPDRQDRARSRGPRSTSAT